MLVAHVAIHRTNPIHSRLGSCFHLLDLFNIGLWWHQRQKEAARHVAFWHHAQICKPCPKGDLRSRRDFYSQWSVKFQFGGMMIVEYVGRTAEF